MRELGRTVIEFFGRVLEFLHDMVAVVPALEPHAWGWAIVLLTLVVRIALLPLAIKQTRSMRAMQSLQPQIKELQKKYKVDRELMRKDPERYRERKQKLNEEMMALYQREGANPLSSCLPLLAQAPIFIALFWTLRDYEPLRDARFYFFTSFGDGGLEMLVSQAGWPGWLLIVLMSGTMFWSQKQMMARTAASGADNPMAQQQKILLYVMPLFLAVISFQFPLGILLYWVTTNAWQVAQQAIILREVQQEGVTPVGGKGNGQKGSKGAEKSPGKPSPGATSGTRGGPRKPAGSDAGGKDADGQRGAGKDGGKKDTDRDEAKGTAGRGPAEGADRPDRGKGGKGRKGKGAAAPGAAGAEGDGEEREQPRAKRRRGHLPSPDDFGDD